MFARARADRAPVLLALGTRWCPWTAAMFRGAYADPEIADLIHDRFVPIRVDANRRPDINERYNLGGWPTTAFLTPEGQILGGETFATPDRLRDLLSRVADAFAARGTEIAARATGDDARLAATTSDAPETELDTWLASHLLAEFDADHGGFGTGAKRVHLEAIELAALRSRAGDTAFAPVVSRTLHAMAWGGLYDHVGGGVFRYCTRRDWTEPSHEKLLDVNAAALRLFVDSDDPSHHELAADLIGYVRRTLIDPGDDAVGFFASQQADASYYLPAGHSGPATREPPSVDRSVYADGTALMARAYVRAAELFDDTSLLEFAATSVEHVVLDTYERGAGIAHQVDDPAGVRGLLTDQVRASAALLDLYAATERDAYLDMAQELMHFSIRTLWDAEHGGGFLDRTHTADDIGLLAEPLRPFAENCEAARVLARLARSAAKPELRERAALTLASQTRTARAYGVDAAVYALAARELVDGDDG